MSWLSFMIDDGSLLMHGVLVFLVLREFVPLRFRNRILHAAEILCLTMVGNVIVYPEEITGTVGSLLGLLPILILFHKGEWYKKLTAALIVYPAMMALAFLFQDIGQWIWKYLFNKDMSDTGQTLLYLLMRCLKVPAWYLIYRSVKAWVPGAIRMLTRRMWLVLAVIALTSFVGIIIIIYKCTYEDSYLAWPACVATLITSMGCCYLCTYMEKIVRSEMELASMQYQKFYYQEIENNQQTVRRMRHDMKNHLSVIETLLRDGKYEKAGGYLHELGREFSVQTKSYCPNPVVNAVLNAKMQKAEAEEILCEYRVELNEALPLEDVDLCSLFANTLDNAIEACVKIGDKTRRRISLKARCLNGQLSYEIENTKENKVTEKNGTFETDKEDSFFHGIGLRNVRQIVEKYEGEMEINYTEDLFRVTIFIVNNSSLLFSEM